MEEKLELLRNNQLLELQTWAGLSLTLGVSGVIVTNDKKIYYYHKYHHVAPSLKGKVEQESLSEGIKLDEKIYKKIIQYIENNILNKRYENRVIMDVSFYIYVNYEGKRITINNYPEIYHELDKIIRGGK